MAEPRGNLVVRRHAPLRQRVLLAASIGLGVFALYFMYEFGRFNAGYDRQAVAQERSEFEVRIDGLEKENHELRTHLAELDTASVGRTQERSELARTIGELQGQVARQAQELAFYRGVITQGDTGSGLKIQQLRITPSGSPQQFEVRLTLVQSAHLEEAMSGVVTLTVEGSSLGKATHLDFAALTDGKTHEQKFSLRYFGNFDQAIELPKGFRPERLVVDLRANRKDVAPLTQSFPWRVEAS
jgi:hypothetical protein